MVQPKWTIDDYYRFWVAASWHLFESVLWTEDVSLSGREVQLRERLRNDEVCNFTRVHRDNKLVLKRGKLGNWAIWEWISLGCYLFNSHCDEVLANMFSGCFHSKGVKKGRGGDWRQHARPFHTYEGKQRCQRYCVVSAWLSESVGYEVTLVAKNLLCWVVYRGF